MKALESDLFFKNKAALDDERLFPPPAGPLYRPPVEPAELHRRATDWYPIYLNSFMIQHFIDYACTLAGNDADFTVSPVICC